MCTYIYIYIFIYICVYLCVYSYPFTGDVAKKQAISSPSNPDVGRISES